jgi:hypothetical protein
MRSKAKKAVPIEDFTLNAITRDDAVIEKRFVVNHIPALEVPGKEFAYCVHDGKFLLIASKTKNPTPHKWIHVICKLGMLHGKGELGFDLTKATFAVVLGGEPDEDLAFFIKHVFDDRGHILRRSPTVEEELVDIVKKASATK